MSTGWVWLVCVHISANYADMLNMVRKDENVIPDPVEPFYDVLNASYPTKGRITEVMKTLNAMGATTIRSHTLGISVGNPLSLMPERGIYNNDGI